MCGICGYEAAHVDADVLGRMNARLESRGPDEEGHCTDGRIALAMRRLQVIDIAGGSQPMANEDGTVRLVFNGEIYNFRELRDELERCGHTFRTRSDTEVIVHGYEQWGDAVVDRLNGMFALALWDARDGSWFLARDRAGEKPLYYHHSAHLFAFASQPAALLEHPGVSRRLDPVALSQYLAFEYVPSPRSIYAAVKKLPAGHRMRVRGSNARVERYWDYPARADAEAVEGNVGSDAAWGARLRSLLGDAVERRLVSDVPLGCFLSGGLDSSALAILMSERLPAGRLQTFSVGFTDPSFDESGYAQEVARRVGAQHHVQMMDAEAIIGLLPLAAQFMDEPLGDGSVLPTFALARFARPHVTVALSGDGGDELLGGYPTLFADRWANRYARFVPKAGHRLLSALARRLPVSHADMSFDFKVRQFLRAARLPSDVRHIGWVGSFLPEELPALLVPEVGEAATAESAYAPVHEELSGGPRREGLDRLLYLYAHFYLAEDLLVKVDRTTMACGLEARAPFLDPEFIRFAAALPARLKVHGSHTKVALREAFAGELPPAILRRRKKGFGMPVGRWLRGPLRPLAEELLGQERLQRQGIFAPAAVARMLRGHLSGTVDFRKQLWTLLSFQLWYDAHIEGR